MLENALVAGICSMGVDALLVGPLPTPSIAFLTRNMRADAGIVISASHNPYQDNGIKIFGKNGFKLPDAMEAMVEDYVFNLEENTGKAPRPTAQAVGKAKRIDDALGRYIVFLKNSFPAEYTLDGLTIAVDCANGATYKVAPAVLAELARSSSWWAWSPTAPTSTPGWARSTPSGSSGWSRRARPTWAWPSTATATGSS